MTVEEYASLFANASDRRLVDTIDHPYESDPLAVDAAKQELFRRRISDARLAELRSESTANEAREAQRKAKVETMIHHVAATAIEAQRTFITDPDPIRTDKRLVRILMIAIGVMLLAISGRYLELVSIAEYGLDWSMVEYFLPLILLPFTIVLLWKRHRAGWFLGAAVTAFSFAQVAASGFTHWGEKPPEYPMFVDLFPTPSKSEIISGVLFAIGLAAGFHLRRSMSIYRITERERWLAVLPIVALVWWKWL